MILDGNIFSYIHTNSFSFSINFSSNFNLSTILNSSMLCIALRLSCKPLFLRLAISFLTDFIQSINHYWSWFFLLKLELQIDLFFTTVLEQHYRSDNRVESFSLKIKLELTSVSLLLSIGSVLECISAVWLIYRIFYSFSWICCSSCAIFTYELVREIYNNLLFLICCLIYFWRKVRVLWASWYLVL